MSSGSIKWFSRVSKYGFISPDDGSADVFVHSTAIVDGKARTLLPTQKVTYKTEAQPDDPSKIRAVEVTRVGETVRRPKKKKISKKAPAAATAAEKQADAAADAVPLAKKRAAIKNAPAGAAKKKAPKNKKRVPPPSGPALLHLSQYSGRIIQPRAPAATETVKEPVIWAQWWAAGYARARGFGKRIVRVQPALHLAPEAAEWSLFFVDTTPGRNPAHTFHKFVLAPASYANPSGWAVLAALQPADAGFVDALQAALDAKCPQAEDTFVHAHIGVLVSSIDSKAARLANSAPAVAAS